MSYSKKQSKQAVMHSALPLVFSINNLQDCLLSSRGQTHLADIQLTKTVWTTVAKPSVCQLSASKVCSIPCSRWQMCTSIPNFSCRCSARCCAEYTLRCCPPVHPNENIRFVKPRSM